MSRGSPSTRTDEINADREVADPDSVFHHYRRLIELRHTDPVVADGDFHMLVPEHPTLYAFTRSLGSETLLVLANFWGEDSAVPDLPGQPDWVGAEVVIGNYAGPADDGDDGLPRCGRGRPASTAVGPGRPTPRGRGLVTSPAGLPVGLVRETGALGCGAPPRVFSGSGRPAGPAHVVSPSDPARQPPPTTTRRPG